MGKLQANPDRDISVNFHMSRTNCPLLNCSFEGTVSLNADTTLPWPDLLYNNMQVTMYWEHLITKTLPSQIQGKHILMYKYELGRYLKHQKVWVGVVSVIQCILSLYCL